MSQRPPTGEWCITPGVEASQRIEWVLRQVELWNSGDVDGVVDAFGPEFEFTPDPSFPDAGIYRGKELREWMREWARTWQDNNLEVLGVAEHGRAVVLECRWHLGAPQSGEAVPVSDFNVVLWFDRDQDDRATRMAAFFDRDRALEAVGGAG
jgi:ketosteroid isomerase-like protein